jgi:hypothetical protein
MSCDIQRMIPLLHLYKLDLLEAAWCDYFLHITTNDRRLYEDIDPLLQSLGYIRWDDKVGCKLITFKGLWFLFLHSHHVPVIIETFIEE